MLHSIYLLTYDYNDFAYADITKKEAPFYLSYLNNFLNLKEINDAYCFFSLNNFKNFSISILADHQLSNGNLSAIIPFLFIPSYYNIGNKKIINIICNDSNTFLSYKKKLCDLAAKQGICNLLISQLNTTITNAEKDRGLTLSSNIIYNDIESFKLDYQKVLSADPFVSNNFYVLNSENVFNNLGLFLKTQEEIIKNTYPLNYQMALKIELLQNENLNIILYNSFLKEELNNYKEHLEILKSSHQAKAIQDYYQEQYEILPLWYKRVGHLIKVLTGKRTFKSLFYK